MKENDPTITAIRECLAKNMPPLMEKRCYLAHKLVAPQGKIATGTSLLS